jgi:predicted Zn-dependent protease with MMP-like domain
VLLSPTHILVPPPSPDGKARVDIIEEVPFHVSPDDFERIAAAALDSIPAPLRAQMDADNLMITVQPVASAHDRDHDIDEHVLGFYEGGEDSVFSAYSYPKRIVLLQRNIERWSANYAELVDQVHDTVLHEVAHYFGMSHRDIEQTRLRH